jgi:DNA uptake protein ComE-like DNA-binding protein
MSSAQELARVEWKVSGRRARHDPESGSLPQNSTTWSLEPAVNARQQRTWASSSSSLALAVRCCSACSTGAKQLQQNASRGLRVKSSSFPSTSTLRRKLRPSPNRRSCSTPKVRQLQQRMTDPQPEPDAPPSEPPPELAGCDDGQVDINTAPEEQLLTISHIGEVRAPEVVRQRPLSTVADMKRVPGIGPVYITDITEQGIASLTNPAASVL